MNTVYLADPAQQRVFDDLRHLVTNHTVLKAIVSLIILYVVARVFRRLQKRAFPRRPLVRPPTLAGGTAKVLSFKKTRGVRLANYYGPGGGNRKTPYICIVELEIHVPGLEPYVRVIKPSLNRKNRAAMQPGKTIGVDVDPSNPTNGYIHYYWGQRS